MRDCLDIPSYKRVCSQSGGIMMYEYNREHNRLPYCHFAGKFLHSKLSLKLIQKEQKKYFAQFGVLNALKLPCNEKCVNQLNIVFSLKSYVYRVQNDEEKSL